MAIDFTLPPDVEAIRQRTREFVEGELRPVEEKLSADSAEAARSGLGPFVLNCQAPDEGNMHTLHSTDTPLANMLKQARGARFADGADEIHQMTIAKNVIAAWQETGSLQSALGDLTL